MLVDSVLGSKFVAHQNPKRSLDLISHAQVGKGKKRHVGTATFKRQNKIREGNLALNDITNINEAILKQKFQLKDEEETGPQGEEVHNKRFRVEMTDEAASERVEEASQNWSPKQS